MDMTHTKEALRAFMFLALMMFSACAGNERLIPNPNPSVIMDDFREGRIVLTCGVRCMGTWMDEKGDIAILVAQRRWSDVVVRVASIGFKENLGYFWLGMAAEALNYPDKALTYYKIAYAVHRDRSASNCKHSPRGACFGIDISGDTERRVAFLEQHLASLQMQRDRDRQRQAPISPPQPISPAARPAAPQGPQALPQPEPAPRSPLEAEWERLRVGR